MDVYYFLWLFFKFCKNIFVNNILNVNILLNFPYFLLFLLCLNRLEFDAYRSDLDELNMGPRDAVTMARIEAAQQQYHVHREKYERLRSDVTIKLKFLEENKVSLLVKVWHLCRRISFEKLPRLCLRSKWCTSSSYSSITPSRHTLLETSSSWSKHWSNST